MNIKYVVPLILVVFLFVAWQVPSLMEKNSVEQNALQPSKPVEIPVTKKVETIRIGIFEPLTGSGEEGGNSELEGILLANELYPMVNGNPIELYIEDNKSDRYETVDAVMKLIEGNKVHALIGSWGSTYALAAGPIINDQMIPTVGASCTNPRITIGNRFYSRVSYIDTFQGTALAEFASQELKADTVAILTEAGDEYSVDLGEYFTNAFAEIHNYNQAILYEGSYQQGQKDFTSLLNAIKIVNPDIIFIPGNYLEVAEIAKQSKALKLTSKIIGTDTLDTSQFTALADVNAEGIYFSTFYSHEFSRTQESRKFLLAYKEKYGKNPTSFSALGYDAYLLIYDALKRSATLDANTLNDAIHSGKNIEGAAGSITMDQNGDTKRPVVIKRIHEGRSVYVTSIEPSK